MDCLELDIFFKKSLKTTSETFGVLLGTRELNDKEKSAKREQSTKYKLWREEKLECLIMKKTSETDITQTDSSTYSNTDLNIAEMLMNWMQSAHQSQSSQSSGYKLYVQAISAYEAQFSLFFFVYFNRKK